MIDKVFFDTNILVYLFDIADEKRHNLAKQFLSEQEKVATLYISAQVVNEFVNITTRKIKNPVTFERQRDILKFLQSVFVVSPLTISTSLTVVDLKINYGFSYWDTLILASALENHCTTVYSEDMQHNQVIEGCLKVVNDSTAKTGFLV